MSQKNLTESYQIFNVGNNENLKMHLLGSHQLKNAATVIESVAILRKKGWNISDENLYRGIEKTKWQGRFQILSKNPTVIIDGGHNPHCAETLEKNLLLYFPEKQVTIIMGVMADKNYEDMIKQIAPIAHKFIAVKPDYYRSLSSEKLALSLAKYHENVICSSTLKNGLITAFETATKDSVICVFGSLYMVSEATRVSKELINQKQL